MFGPAEYVLNIPGEQKICAVLLFLTAMVNLGLNFLLIPYFGLIGAASATALSLTLAAILFFIAIKVRLKINIFALGSKNAN